MSLLPHLQTTLTDNTLLHFTSLHYTSLDNFPHSVDQCFLRRPHCFKCCTTEKKTLKECRVCHGVAHCTAEACVAEFETAHPRDACEKHALILASWVMKMQQG